MPPAPSSSLPPAPTTATDTKRRLALDDGREMAVLDLDAKRRLVLPTSAEGVRATLDGERLYVVHGATLEALTVGARFTRVWQTPLPFEPTLGDGRLGVVVTEHGIAVVQQAHVTTFDRATGAVLARAEFPAKDGHVPIRGALDVPPIVASTLDDVIVVTDRGPIAVPLGELVIDARRTPAGPCVVTMLARGGKPSRHVVCFAPAGAQRFTVDVGGETPWAWTDRHLLLGDLAHGQLGEGEMIDLRTGTRTPIYYGAGIVEDGQRTLQLQAEPRRGPESGWSLALSEIGAPAGVYLWTQSSPTGASAYAIAAIGSDLLLATSEDGVDVVSVERRARDSGALVWRRSVELGAAPTNAYVRTDVTLEVLGDRIVVRARTGFMTRPSRELHVLDVATGADAH